MDAANGPYISDGSMDSGSGNGGATHTYGWFDCLRAEMASLTVAWSTLATGKFFLRGTNVNANHPPTVSGTQIIIPAGCLHTDNAGITLAADGTIDINNVVNGEFLLQVKDLPRWLRLCYTWEADGGSDDLFAWRKVTYPR